MSTLSPDFLHKARVAWHSAMHQFEDPGTLKGGLNEMRKHPDKDAAIEHIQTGFGQSL